MNNGALKGHGEKYALLAFYFLGGDTDNFNIDDVICHFNESFALILVKIEFMCGER